MIQAAIKGGGHTEINLIVRDEGSPHSRYSSASYEQILEKNIDFISQSESIFMHDNAPIHSAHRIKNWLSNQGVNVLNQPPYSPDLNPIEHAQAKLKETIYKLDPDLESREEPLEARRERFKGLIQQAWEALGQEYFDGLIRSMDDRINAVLAAKGWYTRY